MGKYMKKSKIAGDVAVMEFPPQSSLGVRTRAKTLALQTLGKSSSSSSSSSSLADPIASSFSYLQLRSRRLVRNKKPQPPPSPPEQRGKCCGQSPNTNSYGVIGNSTVRGSSVKSVSSSNEEEGHFLGEVSKGSEAEESVNVCIEGSFGENFFEVEGRDRTTSQIILQHMQRNIPMVYEMEEFFAFAEKQQQRIFTEKYNFDIVNDVPLPGRYEWVQVLH